MEKKKQETLTVLTFGFSNPLIFNLQIWFMKRKNKIPVTYINKYTTTFYTVKGTVRSSIMCALPVRLHSNFGIINSRELEFESA